jgi:hypothetical protein
VAQQHELSKKVEEANHTLGDFENAKRKESLRERESFLLCTIGFLNCLTCLQSLSVLPYKFIRVKLSELAQQFEVATSVDSETPVSHKQHHTAKDQYCNFETNIPRKGIAQLQPVSTFMCL